MNLDRRSVLVAGLAAGLAHRARASAGSRSGARDADELAARLIQAPRPQALEIAGRALRGGAERDDLLAATLLAGLSAIRPRPLGSEWHAVMMLAPVARIAQAVPAIEADAAALWAVDEFKASQERARERWDLPPPRPLAVARAGAERELVAGLDGHDPEQAERAASALVRAAGPSVVFEHLWAYGARSFAAAGHHVIAVAQTERALRRFGAAQAEPAVRALALGLAAIEDGPDTAASDGARLLAAGVPADWEVGAEAPARSLELLQAVRDRSPREAQQAVVAALKDGLGPRTVWDGLRLQAAELVLRRPDRRRVLPIHALTEMESLGYAATRARSADGRLYLLLQAAAWMPQVRDAVARRNGAYAVGPTIDAPIEDEPIDLDRALASRSAQSIWTALEHAPGAFDRLELQLCRELVPRADASHHYKFLAAALDESARVDRRWRARILACGLDYLPARDEPETDVHRRARGLAGQ